jgi:excisionase family DNA binding protein
VSTGDEKFLTVADVARILRLNQQTVRNWIDAGTLPALRVGRRVRVRRSDLDALVQRGYTGSPSPAETSQAQAFWEGELHPTSVAALGDDN